VSSANTNSLCPQFFGIKCPLISGLVGSEGFAVDASVAHHGESTPSLNRQVNYLIDQSAGEVSQYNRPEADIQIWQKSPHCERPLLADSGH
jgi:hypothetical protein